MPSKLDVFFAGHPVFTVHELDSFLSDGAPANIGTRQQLLAHHQRQGHIRRVRRGLYASIPAGAVPPKYPVDPFQIAARLTDDAAISHHAALAFHGRAYTVRTQYTFVTRQPHVMLLRFQGNTFRAVNPPRALVRSNHVDFGVESAERAGLPVRVTSLERTLVDVLDRPDLAGGWEEVWHSYEDVAYLDIDQVITYALLLDNATVAAKVGYFLEQHSEALGIFDDSLDRLRRHRPQQPHYISADRRDGRLVSAWNLVVPTEVFGMNWREVS
ncbi:MAG: type IV toxin-antitoxin system AbiEi family antitoxin domain-containing protein [Capsulimonadaceae bacterium]